MPNDQDLLNNITITDQKTHLKYNNHNVTMSNALAKAAHGLTLNEKRLIALAIRQIDSRKPPSHNKSVFRVHADEMMKNYDMHQKTAYRDLKAAGRGLFERKITFVENEGEIETDLRWVWKSKYKEGEGWVEIAFTDDLMPHLTDLKQRFATYRLDQAKALKKSYSWRILELMMAHKAEKGFSYKPHELAKVLDAPKSYDVGSLKRRILEPSALEINKTSGWTVYITYKKAGRSISLIRFDFHPSNQLELI